MEALILASFDNLSSYDLPTIRKGIAQLERLLGRLCLSNSREQDASMPRSPACLHFLQLQNGFELNVSLRLMSCLDRVLGMRTTDHTSQVLLSCLDLLQGVLLLHPRSRQLFARESHINTLIDLLDVGVHPSVQSATVLTLVCALLDQPQNTRKFEEQDGLQTITSLFKRQDTADGVKLKIIEFLYFYLLPEPISSEVGNVRATNHEPKQREVSSHSSRTTAEKQKILGKYLKNVDDLVADLKESQPFC